MRIKKTEGNTSKCNIYKYVREYVFTPQKVKSCCDRRLCGNQLPQLYKCQCAIDSL